MQSLSMLVCIRRGGGGVLRNWCRGMCSVPELMFPFGGGTVTANADEPFLRLYNKKVGEDLMMSGVDELMSESTVVGSSHGWIALYNKKRLYGDLFLWDPLSGHQFKLPPMKTLLPNIALTPYSRFRDVVKKVIISSSPDEDECRAMMIFNTTQLAFCRPTCPSPRWSRIRGGDVYSASQNRFFCITAKNVVEAWKWDSATPTLDWSVPLDDKLPRLCWSRPNTFNFEDEDDLERMIKYLVFDEESEQLLIVTRHLLHQSAGATWSPLSEWYPYKTIGFDVHRLKNKQLSVVKSLGGASIFIGKNQSLAIRAPLNNNMIIPNSIYFTDTFGSHDIGVFDHENSTFAHCAYYTQSTDHRPTHVAAVMPPPFWFIPASS